MGLRLFDMREQQGEWLNYSCGCFLIVDKDLQQALKFRACRMHSPELGELLWDMLHRDGINEVRAQRVVE